MKKSDRRLYAEWFDNERERWQFYHNTKETRAWLATALALGGVAVALGSGIELRPGYALPATFGLFLAHILLIVFLNMQFRARWTAANYSEVLMRAKAKLLAGDNLGVLGIPEGERWPTFIADDIKQVQDRKPRKLLRLKDPRLQSEWASYLATGLAAAALLPSIWPTTSWKILFGGAAVVALAMPLVVQWVFHRSSDPA